LGATVIEVVRIATIIMLGEKPCARWRDIAFVVVIVCNGFV
jgi:hypothetical protein